MAADKVPLEELLVEKGVLSKEDADRVQKTALAKWVDLLTFSGDLRVRHETFFDDNNANGTFNNGVNQHRERYRLRIGTELKMGDFTAGIRLDSGTGQQMSTNQTYTTLFTQKAIFIDRVYISWQGSRSKWLKISAGKIANPFFVLYSGDVVWDADINPEGFGENLKFSPADGVTLFLNGGQFVLNESATNNHDPWMLAEQGGISVEPTSQVKATLATAFYESLNVSGRDAASLAGTVQQGNSRNGTNLLLNNYRVLDVTAVVDLKAGPIPIALMGDYIQNLANTTTTGLKTGAATGNQGYQVGLIVGKAADAHTWELAYFYKMSQTDATLADLADADIGSGGTAHRGHIVWGAYNLTKYFQMKVKYFMTKSITPVTTAATVCGGANTNGCGDVNRLQADLEVKF